MRGANESSCSLVNVGCATRARGIKNGVNCSWSCFPSVLGSGPLISIAGKIEMRFLTLTSLWLLSLFPSCILSGSVECSRSLPIQAPLDDCREVVQHMNQLWQQPGMNTPRHWGHYYETNLTHTQIPLGFYLKPTGHTRRVFNCAFRVDTKPNQLQLTDVFTLQQLTIASNGVLERCYPLSQNGYGYPSQQGNVFSSPRYQYWNEASTGIEMGEYDGYVLMMTDESNEPDVQEEDPSVTS